MQSARPKDLGKIDIFNMTDEQKQVLHQFLISRSLKFPKLALANKDVPFEVSLNVDDKPVRYSFKLSKDILIRPRAHVPGEYRFEVLEDENPDPDAQLGGAFGQIRKILATLASEMDELVIQTNKHRIVKVQAWKSEDDKESLENEYQMTKRVDHMHVKPPVIVELLGQSFTVMRQLNDTNLHDARLITTDQLIELSILLGLGHVEQVLLNHFYHGDIKPENIMATKDFLRAFFLDFGISVDSSVTGSADGLYGTAPYVAPERITDKREMSLANLKTDIFELGATLAELWGIPNPRNNHSSDKLLQRLLKEYVSPVLMYVPNRIQKMKYFNELSSEHVSEILALFERMTSTDPEKRLKDSFNPTDDSIDPDPAEVIAKFEKIRLERLFFAENKTETKIDDERKRSIINANIHARDVRRKIVLLQKKPTQKSTFIEIKKIISDALENFNSHGNYECKEFLHRLGISALVGLKNKNEINEKLEQVHVGIEKYGKVLAKLIQQTELLAKHEFVKPSTKRRVDGLLKKLRREEKKYHHKAADIDELVTLNERLSKALPNYKQLLENVRLEKLFTAKNIIDKTLQQSIVMANQEAKRIRKEIVVMQRNPTATSFAELSEKIKKTLDKFKTDDEYQEFLYRLKIQAFVDLQSKDEVNTKLRQIQANIEKNSKSLSALVKQTELFTKDTFAKANTKLCVDTLLNELCEERNEYTKKYVEKGASIDELIVLNERLSQGLLGYKQSLDNLVKQNLDEGIAALDSTGMLAESVDFLRNQAQRCNFNRQEREDLCKEFFVAINDESKVTSRYFKPLNQVIAEYLCTTLVRLYERSFNLLYPEFSKDSAEFLKVKINSIINGKKESYAELHEQFEEMRNFMRLRLTLMKIFSNEMEIELAIEAEAKVEAKVEAKAEATTRTPKLSDCYIRAKNANTLEDLSNVVANVPKSLLAVPFSFRWNKQINPLQQALDNYKNAYLSEVSQNKVAVKRSH